MNSIMSKYGIQNVDFIKMDIEGAEFDFFRRICTPNMRLTFAQLT